MGEGKAGFEPGYTIARSVLVPWISAWFRLHFEGLENIPASGPAIVGSNHISYFDPLVVAYGIDKVGRRPRFLAKSGLFKYPVVGSIIRSAKQIPVERGSRAAPQSLEHAERALADGEVLVVFPEGTTTTAPDLAPLKPKNGISRLALKTGAPVIPCATWGGQWFWTKHLGVKPGPGKEVWVRYGQPMWFKEYEGREEDPAAWREVAEIVMDEISILLAGLKAAKPWLPQAPTRKKFIRAQQEATRFERRD